MTDKLADSIRPEDEDVILARTEERLRSTSRLHAASTLLHNIGLLFRMMRDRTFTMQWSTRALILSALVYFLLPTDATPDYIPLVGYVDDTLIVGWVIKRLAREIERYRIHHSA
jgi:uncharacterized membrane protein YkvA (DUF1232 family)